MTGFARDSWKRAQASLASANILAELDPDSTASRAYYAAFHAVTAYFALQETCFSKHSQLRVAVHRDLVHTGLWPGALGEDFDILVELREMGDYGGRVHVSEADAKSAVERAGRILDAIAKSCGDRLEGEQ